MAEAIHAVAMPKLGLAMTEGKVNVWLVAEGSAVAAGQDIAEVETTKITNVLEAPVSGILRRHHAREAETVPVGGLLAVIADREIPDAQIDAFIERRAVVRASQEDRATTDEHRDEFVAVNDHQLHFIRAGDGRTPVLFLHGFGSDVSTWSFNQQVIAAQTATYALDLPGHGRSSKAIRDGSVGGLSEIVAGFLDAHDVPRVHLVGHSLGGAIALRLALQDPRRVATLTLISPADIGTGVNAAFVTGFMTAKKRRELHPVLEMLVENSDLVTGAMVEATLKYKRLDGVEDALARIAAAALASQSVDDAARLSTLAVPTQVICGTRDRIIPSDYARHLPEKIAVRALENTGHLPHVEKSDDVNRMILEFIRTRE